MTTKRVTIHTLQAMKERGDKITMLTCYDFTFASLLDQSSVEMLLVGDSLGMVVQGQDTTIPVSIEDITYHTRAVVRGSTRAHVVADMPFMSYQSGPDDAVATAGRLMKEGGAHSVKLEGGQEVAESVERIVRCGIPVMGHIGLTPQSFHAMGGFKVQGKEQGAGQRLMADALALQEAGAYSIVLEGIPRELAAEISSALKIPTIGIGAGNDCDGQVLVIYDLLGMDDSFRPKFVRRYEQLGMRIRTAVDSYVADVKDQRFPSEDESFHLQSRPKKPRRAASVSAMAHVGGCAPVEATDTPSASGDSQSKEDSLGGLYSGPKKK